MESHSFATIRCPGLSSRVYLIGSISGVPLVPPLFDRIFKQGGTQASSQILAAQRNFDEFDVISYRKPYKNDVFEVFSMKKRQIFSRLRRAVVKSHQNLV